MKIGIVSLLLIMSQALFVTSNASAKSNAYHKVVSHFAQHNVFSGAVLVAKDGKVVFEGGYGLANETWQVPNTTDTKFNVGSLTKSMTAMLVIKLVQEGKLSLSDTVDKYLDFYPKDKARAMSIKDLLGHKSGLPRQFVLPGWRDGKFDRFDNKVQYAKLIGELDLLAAPGEDYHYTNLGYFLLGLIVEQATKTTFESALSHYVLTPLKMDNTGTVAYKKVIKQHATGYRIAKAGGYERPGYLNVEFLFWAEGNVYSTVGDILKFDQGLYSNVVLDQTHRNILLSADNGFSWSVDPWKVTDKSKARSSINWGGEIPGYSSFLLRFTDTKDSIIIVSNNAVNEIEKRRLASELAAILYGEHTDPTKMPLSFVLTKALFNDELDQQIDKLKGHTDNYLVDDSIATMGLQQMWSGELTKALSLLSFNAEILPDSASAHDSLSKVHEERGQLSKALISAKRALGLLPHNQYLKSRVARLKLAVNDKG